MQQKGLDHSFDGKKATQRPYFSSRYMVNLSAQSAKPCMTREVNWKFQSCFKKALTIHLSLYINIAGIPSLCLIHIMYLQRN